MISKKIGMKICVGIIIYISSAFSTNYFIDQKNPTASDQNDGSFNSPWKTISKSNKVLIAGDTLFIKAGVYNNGIEPVNSGTALKPIVFKNYGKDSVVISDAAYGILLNAKSHITIQGINFFNLDCFLWLQDNSNNNIIAHCTFNQGRSIGWSGAKIYKGSSYNRIHHCLFSNYGKYTNDDIGTILDIGNEESQTDLSKCNLLENCTFFHGGHHILGVFGMYNVIRHNYFHNENWLNGYGNRNVYLAGYPVNSLKNLIDGNRIAYSGIPPDNWGAAGMSLTTSYNIVRFNKFYHNNTAGIAMTLTSSYYSDIVFNKIYHNTFLHNGFNMATGPDALTSAIGFALYSGSHVIKNNSIINNLYYGHYQPHGTYNVKIAEQEISNNWNGDKQGEPRFFNATLTLGNPMDSTVPDLHLKNESPCVDSGKWLTTITSPDGSGTSFQVADAGFFFDGWGISEVQGDEIQLSGTQERVRIVTINYSINMITVNKNIAWKQNQGLSVRYSGTAPDPGAYEVTIPQSLFNKENNNPQKEPGKSKSIMNQNTIKRLINESSLKIYSASGKCLTSSITSEQLNRIGKGVYIICNKNGSLNTVIISN